MATTNETKHIINSPAELKELLEGKGMWTAQTEYRTVHPLVAERRDFQGDSGQWVIDDADKFCYPISIDICHNEQVMTVRESQV